ncbi:MAG: allose kinase [Clostridia bacterium]|nr:allose kinase [Clostridia bacterium]
MSSEFYTLGIDIGGTHFRMGLVGKEGQVLAYEKHPTAVLMGEDPAALLGDAISEYCLRHGARDHVVAACIGLPATVDKARERVLNAPNVRGFDGVPLGRILRKRLGVPVLIERDVNVQLLADMRRLDIQSGDVLACYVGTGIGNAILLGGALLTGHHGVAGELGHIPFGDSQQPCGCGNTGCAEGLAGGLYLAALARDVFCRTPIEELFVRHGEAAELREYIERLGRVIATEINILDPEVLLLGGGVIGMAGFPKAMLEKSIRAHTRKPLPHDGLRILYSAGNDGKGGVLGAGIFAWRSITE